MLQKEKTVGWLRLLHDIVASHQPLWQCPYCNVLMFQRQKSLHESNGCEDERKMEEYYLGLEAMKKNGEEFNKIGNDDFMGSFWLPKHPKD